MSLLASRDTRVLVQGITGNQGSKTTREMVDYGTPVVAGVTPGRAGETVHGVPVYDSVRDALHNHPEINTSLVCVPRDAAMQAAMSAIEQPGIKLVNILTEGMTRQDAARIVAYGAGHNVRVVGPASVGIIVPRARIKLGAIGGNDPGIFYPGPIAIFSKSGGMCLSIATDVFNRLGYGTSMVVGIGGDRITGTNFVDLLEMVKDDAETKLVILMGEVGGTYEEEAAQYMKTANYPKPVIARLTGIGAQNLFPKGSRMGHAGAIIGEGSTGTYESKVWAFKDAGVAVAETPDELIELVEKALPRKQEVDIESPVSEELELVSISKQKLEGLKSEVRAVRIRTAMTRLIDGVPYFRGYALSELVERASIPQMMWMALTRQDPVVSAVAQVAADFEVIAKIMPPNDGALQAAETCVAGGGAFNAAIAAGLMAMAEPDLDQPVLKSMRGRYSAPQLRALAVAAQVIPITAHLFGNRFAPKQGTPLEKSILECMSGAQAGDAQAEVFRAMYVSCVEHTPATPSSLAAIASYSGGASLKTALAAGISAMGDVHAGAGEKTARLLMDVVRPFRNAKAEGRTYSIDGVQIDTMEDLANHIVDRYSGKFGGTKKKIPGYGHRYYSLYGHDPRAESVLQVIDKAGIQCEYVRFVRILESCLKRRKSHGLCINVDGVIGGLLFCLGLKPEAGKALFILPRTIGIMGQLLEQQEGSFFRLSNESVLYVGPRTGRPFEA